MNRGHLAGGRGGSGHATPPHMFQHEPGVLFVTCGHCGQSFHTDSNGHAEHTCQGCCEQHQPMEEDIDGTTDERPAEQAAQQ